MRPIRIDFAPRSFKRALLRTRPITLFLVGAGLLLCIGAMLKAIELTRQHDAVQARILDMKEQLRKRAELKPAPKKFQIPENQENAVNNTIAQLNLPWRDVFDAIESATPGTVALLTLTPDAKKHAISGTAEAKNSDGMIAYIEQLKKQPFFGAVVLTRHEINEQDPNKPIRFQFEAQWTESTP